MQGLLNLEFGPGANYYARESRFVGAGLIIFNERSELATTEKPKLPVETMNDNEQGTSGMEKSRERDVQEEEHRQPE